MAPYAGLLAFDEGFRVSDGFAFRGLKDAAVFGGRLGYTLSRRLGVEGSLAVSSQAIDPSSQAGSGGVDADLTAYLAEALLYLASGPVIPFVAVGGGGMSFSTNAELTDDESSSGAVASVGGGFKLPLSPMLAVRLDARDLLVRRDERSLGSLFGGEGQLRHNVALSAGVALRFGGPADEDSDGIYDDRDRCPGTRAGSPVDENGCEPRIPEGPPPVRTDGDGDGVSDGLDRCPGTPAGVVVDLDGCPIEGAGEGTSGTNDK
ncbi:MAG: outer membrane beta-barrel protein [Gemmatimonadetes bacterium]|nr:outer membrane beta-barrel protein [Gemmatimonadota bacterium]MBA3556736.1 outer membrane beta-barrel protein [Gemmatimonadales bacterium]